MTNLAEAIAQQPAIAVRIARVLVSGGAPLYGLGNGADLNMNADAPAVQSIVQALPGRVWFDGEYATSLVPLDRPFRERLAADRSTPAANVVYSMASDPLLMSAEAEQFNPQGTAYWWDPLATVAATTWSVVSFIGTNANVVTSGPQAGRLAITSGGTAIQFADWARADRFHQIFIDVLNDRLPVGDV
jgi:inosine-uridine nucleoside N-ribohydrolase